MQKVIKTKPLKKKTAEKLSDGFHLPTPLALAIFASCAYPSSLFASETTESKDEEMEQMVVTGVKTELPLNLVTDPKKPRQPLPANDGADYLKTIPGFTVVRKGGTSGDPLLRGMGGSRLGMLLDGESMMGGCPGRMDPPTAYIFPESLDEIEVVKGPQTVLHGPGNSAGVVLFKQLQERPTKNEWDMHASLLAGNAERKDGLLDIAYKTPQFSLRGSSSSASADDYEDGDGNKVHSNYERWSGMVNLAWTPDDDTRLEFDSAFSDAEAAYADRGVDGSKFARENYKAKYRHSNIGDLLNAVEVQVYYNYIDHIMDNYSLREPSGMTANPIAMNLDSETLGGKVSLQLTPVDNIELATGLDMWKNRHRGRMSMNQARLDYRQLNWDADAEFSQLGIFSEASWQFAPDQRWIAGARLDDWEVKDLRETISVSMMSKVDNPTAGESRSEQLHSGFIRYELALPSAPNSSTTLYAGLGYSERFPDYWEIFAREGENSYSALDINSEKTTQLDIGYIYRSEKLSASISTFTSDIRDYLLVQNDYQKAAVPMGMGDMTSMSSDMDMGESTDIRTTAVVRNVQARTWGLELDASYQLSENWRTELTLTSVRGANDTDKTTLAQLPPLETRLGLHYEQPQWSAGVLWRAISSQDRVDIGKGNIIGQDFGTTDSADVLSINAGWRPGNSLLITTGIDNLLDETYAEHVSRAGAEIPNFPQISRVNEPGRTFWLKAVYRI
ncbi:colicin I receptor [Microbulbifer sp. NBRC 101763]|uniref:TonB-dependent copper receptor n=1 Tax=unclassified Microbulbifer TaxID=2619833 RepID=UPI0024AD4F77|nr:TonB-dependent copper receptor [Microbulbifer sp. MLAF003]WHI51487.1 TonB-dependent copper receptor [Microbulbifer sp. MLAF003]